MPLPVIQHRLTKVGRQNRRRFIKCSVVLSTIACAANIISVCTNNWLYTSEVLKYYVFPNRTAIDQDENIFSSPTYCKNATIGPWYFCWLDPVTEFHCNEVDLLAFMDDPSDVTSSVEQSVRFSYIFMFIGLLLDVFGFLSMLICCARKNPYKTLFFSTVTHIFAGLTNFMCVLEFMSAVFKEVGNKIYPASEMEDPLFTYTYGFSLILIKVSFLCTETAAIFLVIVYMSKRDERLYNRYQMCNLLKRLHDHSELMDMTANRCSRFGRIRTASMTNHHHSDEMQKPPLFLIAGGMTSNRIHQFDDAARDSLNNGPAAAPPPPRRPHPFLLGILSSDSASSLSTQTPPPPHNRNNAMMPGRNI